MGFKCGIVGLPNVGKSTLFNALTETAAAQAANYPFCTIEPNVGEVAVPDPRLDRLAQLGKSEKIVPTRLTFVDIAGLVRGASKGEGLGNQFLANIREVDAIAHVVRCFEDSDVTHVENRIDPIADIETIETELMLADLDSLERRVDALEKKARGNDKEAKEALDLVNRALALLREGRLRASSSASPRKRRPSTRSACSHRCRWSMSPMSRKPRLRRATNIPRRSNSAPAKEGEACVVISAQIEAEIAVLPGAERAEYLAAIGLQEPGLDRLIRAGYDAAASRHVLHRRAERGARLDGDARHPRAAGGGRDPYRFRARLHPRGNHRL